MYRLTEEQRNTLIYILERLTVTGPTQGGLLNNAALVLRSLKPEKPEMKPEPSTEKEEN